MGARGPAGTSSGRRDERVGIFTAVVVVSGEECWLNAGERYRLGSSAWDGNFKKRFMAGHHSVGASIRRRKGWLDRSFLDENVRSLVQILGNLYLLYSMCRGGNGLESFYLEAEIGECRPLLLLQLLVP